jgi:hypothetical protein
MFMDRRHSRMATTRAARSDGKLHVRAVRNSQANLDGGLGEVVSFAVEDNGIGFTDAHRDSFDTLYTDLKIGDGGKGFGRFIGLKYFEDLQVRSVYRDGVAFKSRCFSMGDGHQIIVGEEVKASRRNGYRVDRNARQAPKGERI